MIRRIVLIIPSFAIAFAILMISVLRTASVKYEFAGIVNGSTDIKVLGDNTTQVNYDLAYPGKVLPDSPLWPVKAARDKIWLATTTNTSREAELLLLFADKRLGASKIFFENNEPERGLVTLQKAEAYLMDASNKERENSSRGMNTSEFLGHIALASLKHRQIIEEEILPLAPDDAKPAIVQTVDISKTVNCTSVQALRDKGLKYPENPFEGH
ncbi:hypothetical protein IPM62_00975 [Candidatus Woesebacteria bacterium]|nr:MAG: hypothetical protein IPM62_00975 [Candidatus Woesebacteria bacterium]